MTDFSAHTYEKITSVSLLQITSIKQDTSHLPNPTRWAATVIHQPPTCNILATLIMFSAYSAGSSLQHSLLSVSKVQQPDGPSRLTRVP